MDLRAFVGAALVLGLAATVAFGACAKRTEAPPASPSQSPALAPAPSTPSPGESASSITDRARAAQSCSEPSVALITPDGGVMFNDAMTSADAGHSDRSTAVVSALDAQSLHFRCCFESWRQDHPAAEGEVMLQVLLAPDGRVSDAGLDSTRSNIQDALTSACIVHVAAETKFPPSPRKIETLVEYPLRVGAQAK